MVFKKPESVIIYSIGILSRMKSLDSNVRQEKQGSRELNRASVKRGALAAFIFCNKRIVKINIYNDRI